MPYLYVIVIHFLGFIQHLVVNCFWMHQEVVPFLAQMKTIALLALWSDLGLQAFGISVKVGATEPFFETAMAAIGGALGSAHWFRASVPFNYWGHECSGLQVGQGTCQGVTYGRDFPTISANYKWLHSVFRPRAPQIRCSWLLSLHPVERNPGGRNHKITIQAPWQNKGQWIFNNYSWE